VFTIIIELANAIPKYNMNKALSLGVFIYERIPKDTSSTMLPERSVVLSLGKSVPKTMIAEIRNARELIIKSPA
jgi:hypothetical protein